MIRPLLLGMGWSPHQFGGLNRYFRALAEGLDELGAEPRAIVAGPAPDSPSWLAAPADDAQLLPLRLWRLARAVPRSELVDAHFALYAFLPLLFGRLRRAALVVHFHGPWADESRASGDRPGAVRAKRWVETRVYRRARRSIVLSQAFRRLLIERYGVSPWTVDVLAPGVDLERFSPGDRAEARTRLGIDASAWVAMTVRRLVPRMGLDTLLESWTQLGCEPRVLLLVGDGPEREALETLAQRHGDSVRFLGRVDDERLVDCYRAADVSVVPSVALEGYGLVVLESLACGTPVVVTDASGLPETVAGLDPSLVVPAGDPSALARRLEEPLPERDRCRRFAERFSWREVAERNLSVYEHAARQPPQERLRVVYLDHTAALSGGELALLRLLPALADDVEAHVVLAHDGPLAARLAQAGISVEVLPLAESTRGLPRSDVSIASGGAFRSALYAIRLARRLRRFRPDVVHTNSLKAALYGGLAGRLAGVPVVWHVRDRIADDYLPASAVGIVRRAARRLPAAVIANSSATLATLPGVRRGRVVASPVDVPPMPHTPQGGPLRVGMVGRIAPWKGQHVFLEAFADAFPHGDERAVVIGAPLFGAREEEYLERLHELRARLGLDGRVELTGFREDVADELTRLDVLVHASVTPEPFGQVVAEGLAAGLPVVAAAAGGPAEMIEDDVSGLLYPPGDTEALAAALRRLAADPALRARLGQAGRESAAEFTLERVSAQVLETYREVLRA